MFHRSVVVRLGRTDAAGVVFFTEPLALCHEVYEALLDVCEMPVSRVLHEEDWALPIVHAEVDLKRPMRVGDILDVKLWLSRDSEHSFAVDYELSAAEVSLATAATVHVCIDKVSGNKRALPDAFRRALREHAGAPPSP